MSDTFHIGSLDDPADPEVHGLLVELALDEQEHYHHPRQSRAQVDATTPAVQPHFVGENVVFVARDDGGTAVGLAWCVLFDPGTGLEGEVAELFVAEAWRGRGVASALCRRAVSLFTQRGVTFASVWTRDNNPIAIAAYRAAGFSPTEQVVLTWLPLDPGGASG